MSFNFTINRNDLDAISHFQAKKDVRYYLNGVHITPNSIESSNGHVLGCIIVSTELDIPSLIVPENTVKLILQKTKKQSIVTCENGIVNGEISIIPVQGKYPDTARFLNAISNNAGTAGQFDPDLLMRFKEASYSLGNHGTFYVEHNGIDAGIVSIPGDERFKGVIMPWRVVK